MNINTKKYIFVDIIHLTLIVYSSFALPLIVGFDLKIEGGLLGLEIACFIESFIYLMYNIFKIYETTGVNSLKHVLRVYYRSGLVFDLIALAPFTIILSSTELEDPIWLLAPLKLLRILTVARIPSLLERVEINFI